jgi:hypothetical protein
VIEVTLGSSKTAKVWVRRATMTAPDFLAMLSKSLPGPKDGECFTPAIFSGQERRKDQADKIDVAVLDSDCGYTLAEIAATIDEAGYEAMIHSTHSHMAGRTEISCTAFEKWKTDTGLDDVPSYMKSKKGKGFLPRVVEGARIVGKAERKGPGDKPVEYYLVEHRPCPKFRIVIFLAAPWRAADFESQIAATSEWRKFYLALAARLGLHPDESCTNVSRLFYLPRTRPGGPPFLHWYCYGRRCDMAAVLAQAPPEAPRGNGHERSGLVLRETDDLARAGRLNGAKQVIECPFEDEHTEPGGEGTIAVNASADMVAAGLPQHANSGSSRGRQNMPAASRSSPLCRRGACITHVPTETASISWQR